MKIESLFERNYKQFSIPNTNKTISYDTVKKIGIGISSLGTNEVIAVGAYYAALNELDQQQYL